MSTAAEDAESVDQFLARIASLKDRRDREDEERIRKVEEEILQGRKERQARRAERARSISPSKSSPAPSSSATIEPRTLASHSIDPPVEFSPPSQTQTPQRSPRMEPTQSPPFSQDLSDPPASRALPTPPPKSSSTPAPTPPTATSLARGGTLSWQKRPSSRDSNSNRPRPLSRSPAPTAADITNAEPEEELSRSQIAKSLATRDPAFFRQTADRGIGSAAYRRNESETDSSNSVSRSMRLPGMSREQSIEPEKSPVSDSEFAKPQLPLQNTRNTNSRTLEGPASTVQSGTSTPARSSPLSTPKLAPTELLASDSRSVEASSSAAFPGWGSSRRPPSPTKGLGGFVESAMMKRSDSVSKRWSVQAAPGLKRGDSVASNRNNLGTGAAVLNSSGSPPRQTRPLRPLSSSSPASSRPTSSYGSSKLATAPETFSTDESVTNDAGTISRTMGSTNAEGTNYFASAVLEPALPVSPTKTMDSRRWSPTKSSWLESALARPDSPKTLPSKSEEPAWKSSMHKTKTSVGSPTPASFEVNTTSLLRSPPVGGHSRPLSISGMPEAFSLGMVKKSPEKTKSATIAEDPRTEAPEPAIALGTGDDLDQRPVSKANTFETLPAKSFSESDPFVASSAATTKRDAPPVKAKPATPPKTDFRSALKSRQVASSGDSNAEPEFKAVFGKLKRTQTKNYIAPDELKHNITKGKASLNLTGGPQKAARVDEFKESILQKKEAMKEGTGLTAKLSVREKPAPTIPEALAKKEAMKTGADLSAKPLINEKPAPVVPEALAKRQLLGKSAVTASEFKAAPVKSMAQLAAPVEIKRQADPESKKSQPSTQKDGEELSLLIERATVLQQAPMAVPQKQELANSKLASRLNPALAGFLSRGASPKTSNNPSPADSTEDLSLMPRGLSRKATNESEEAGGTTLTHITKARAKGPKRRAPKAEAIQSTSTMNGGTQRKPSIPGILQDASSGGRPLPQPEPTSSVQAASKSTPVKVEPTLAGMSKPKPLADILKGRPQPEQHKSEAPKEVTEMQSTPSDKPIVVAKSLELRKVTSVTPKPAPIEDKPPVVSKSPELKKVASLTPKPAVADTPASPVKDRMGAFNIAQDRSQSPADKPVTYVGGWNKPPIASPVPSPLVPSTTKLNTPRSPSISNAAQQKPPVTKSTKPASGLGLNLTASSKQEDVPTTTELTPPPEKPQSLDVKKSLPTNGMDERERVRTGKLRGGSSAKTHFTSFFNQSPKARDKADFDTQAVMSVNEYFSQKMKTLSMAIWEITGNGKKEAMPTQQEHILFEDSMYLCVHALQRENGSKTTEAHLWVGDTVSEAAVEDAQLFCRKIARENSAKLEVLKQGKETPNFFQALGGILITRRNKHSALYMLCGRRHLGHVAFDEVDLEASSLCSGFPFIVSAKFGKLFLWQGRGSGADELGCARLIGMDLGLTGEIEEVNEGEEPKAFWESFASKTRSKSSDLWDLKSTLDAYSCRLYRVEIDRSRSATGFWARRGSSPPKSPTKALVEEISPFCQGDLSPQHIYLLDAYFEIYVYVGDQASSKHAEFTTALMLAQEISMLAPTLQDRPLMPACHLVFGNPPRDFKATLRKWEDERYEKSLEMPLDEAIDALE